MADDDFQLHVDSDWKAQAQAEKEKLRQKEEAKQQAEAAEAAKKAAASSSARATAGATTGDPTSGASGGGDSGGVPEASFETLLQQLGSQAMLYMGGMPDGSGRQIMNLDAARLQIDLLAVIEEKTKNNITQQQSDELANLLYQLRSRYVAVSSSLRQK